MNIRSATLEDAECILEIYKPYVLETPISFELIPPNLDEMKRRVSSTLDKSPWLIAEEDNQILGYAYGDPFRSRPAYAWSAEASIYLDQACLRKGIGSFLYEALIDDLKLRGYINIIGGVTLPNAASVRLHEKLGFQKVAQFKRVGFKFDQWWDVGYWQLQFELPALPSQVK